MRSLIIVRAGRNSLHPSWIDPGCDRDWDIYVCPYEDAFQVDRPAEGITVGSVIPGPKWTGLRTLLRSWTGWRDYRYVMLADDDLLAPHMTWSNFFKICSAFNIKLAQPALTQDSSFSHLITVQNGNFMVRRVGFVEIMMPCLRVDVLSDLLPTLDLTNTGWGFGLDLLWSYLLSYKDLMVVDCAPVQHTRPVGIMRDDELGRRNTAELEAIQRRFGAQWMMDTFSGIDQHGREIERGDPSFAHRYLTGYWPVLKDSVDGVNQIVRTQFKTF